MKGAPDWAIQVSWWISGIFATGAVWYFLSVKSYAGAVGAGVAALLFAGLAVALHRRKDAASEQSATAGAAETPAEEFARRYTDQPSHIRFVKALPKMKAVVHQNAQEGWDTGVTADMREASYDVINFLEFAWLRLAEFYPPKHFGKQDASGFIRTYIRDRFAYHWAKHEPAGPGTGGTIVGILAGGDVIRDLEEMIADAVGALFMYDDSFDYEAWLSEWRSGAGTAPNGSDPQHADE